MPEVTGFAATSDGHDMVAPSGEGGERAMRLALQTLPEGRKVGYINAHGTSTWSATSARSRRCAGCWARHDAADQFDQVDDQAGATGAQEAIYRTATVKGDYIAPSINVETLDPALDPAEIASTGRRNAGLDTVMTNSFGFGGTNGSMLLSRFVD